MAKKRKKSRGVFFGWEENSGLICLWYRGWSLHLAVRGDDWMWGKEEFWYDGPMRSWGLGPVFLLAHYDDF